MKITNLVVDKLDIPLSDKPGKTAQKRYYDDTIKGFGVRVTSGGTKAFFVEKLIKFSETNYDRVIKLNVLDN